MRTGPPAAPVSSSEARVAHDFPRHDDTWCRRSAGRRGRAARPMRRGCCGAWWIPYCTPRPRRKT